MKAIDKIRKFKRFGSKLGLERMHELLRRLGNPEGNLRVIHVAGTNGKGSVCAFIDSVLRENGYSTALYTSPFIENFQERIQVNGVKISDDELEEVSEKVLKAVEQMLEDGADSPTEFEVVTAIALLFFAKKKPEFTILEVGLGGRGDSTNVIANPLLSIITSISFDHTDRLGNTIDEIAAEKAGIIKEGCTIISNTEDPVAAKVIAKKAYEMRAPFIDASKIKPINVGRHIDYYTFSADIRGKLYLEIEISMIGDHQIRNAICALSAIDELRNKKAIRVEKEKLQKGMRSAKQPGRFEILENGELIFDGAHNESGAIALANTVGELFPGKKILTIVGMLNDKDASEIIRQFNRFTSEFIVTEPQVGRNMPANELAKLVVEKPKNIFVSADEAYEYAQTRKEDFDIIIIAGSLYLIGQLRGKGGERNEY